MNTERLVARIDKMKSISDPNSPKLRQALTRIGTVLQAEMKLNIGRQKIIDQGNLLNSIKYVISQRGNQAVLEVGSFGVKYAAQNEFGGPMTQKQVRAMFASMAERGRVPGRVGGAGVVTVNKNQTGFWRARPYVRPAIEKHQNFVIEILRSLVRT